MIRINLLQREGGEKVEKRPQTLGKWRWIIVGCVVAVVLVVSVVKFGLITGPRISRVVPLEKVEKPSKVKVAEKVIDEKGKLLMEAKRNGVVYLNVLNNVEQSLPPFVWLTSVSISYGEAFFVEGVGRSFSRIKEFQDRLEQSPLFAELSIPLIRKGEFNGVQAFKFTIGGKIVKEKVVKEKPLKAEPLSTSAEIKGLLDQIEKMGKENGLSVLWLDKGRTLRGKYFDQVMVKGGMKGRYRQVHSFMEQLIFLKEVVSPVKLVITPPTWEEGLPPDEVRVAFDLDVYVAKE